MIKNLLKYLTSCILVIVALGNIYVYAFHEDPDPGEFNCEADCSIEIDYYYDGEPLENVTFKVYYIAALDEDYKYELTADFTELDIDCDQFCDSDYWIGLRDELDNYIDYEVINPLVEFTTDDEGSYYIENIKPGIYYIEAEVLETGNSLYISEPTLMIVGEFDQEDDRWLYNYVVKPKIEMLNDFPEEETERTYRVSVQKIWKDTSDATVIPTSIKVELYKHGFLYDTVTLKESNNWYYSWSNLSSNSGWSIKEIGEIENFEISYRKSFLNFYITNTYLGPPDQELPQTGTLTYYIPAFSSLGLILILLGVLLGRKGKKSA